MKNSLILSTLLFCIGTTAFSQKKKDLISENVSTKIEWKIEIKNGVEHKFKEAEYKFDKKGNMILEKEYNEKGGVIKHREYEYNKDGNLVIELHYNAKKQLTKREEFSYNGNLKTEKRTFGEDRKLKSKKIYEYILN